MIEHYLLSLFISAFILPLTISCLLIMLNSFSLNQTIQDEIAIIQLRRILLVARDIKVMENSITYTYHNEPWILETKDRRLYIKPGTQIVMDDLNSCYFSNQDRIVKIYFSRKGIEYERIIAIE